MIEYEMLKKIANIRRSAWLPVVKDGDGELTASKFSGIPWLAHNEEWPLCPNCNQPLNLFVQLNLKDLPEIPDKCKPDGLIQLFYCIRSEPSCETDCEAFLPFSQSVVVRRVDPSDAIPREKAYSPPKEAFPPKQIINWEKKDDYPNWEELSESGLSLSDAEENLLYELGFPLTGDKLLGWPAWVQGIEYPDCPDCEERMHLLFQTDSEDNIPYMFGDVGCGHITQCPNHPDTLSFGWACA